MQAVNLSISRARRGSINFQPKYRGNAAVSLSFEKGSREINRMIEGERLFRVIGFVDNLLGGIRQKIATG